MTGLEVFLVALSSTEFNIPKTFFVSFISIYHNVHIPSVHVIWHLSAINNLHLQITCEKIEKTSLMMMWAYIRHILCPT